MPHRNVKSLWRHSALNFPQFKDPYQTASKHQSLLRGKAMPKCGKMLQKWSGSYRRLWRTQRSCFSVAMSPMLQLLVSVASFFEQWIALKLHNNQYAIDWQLINNLFYADEQTLRGYLIERCTSCSCLGVDLSWKQYCHQ
eukprot:scaffold10104_cov91-Skeletonema_marinoi.AAC.4